MYWQWKAWEGNDLKFSLGSGSKKDLKILTHIMLFCRVRELCKNSRIMTKCEIMSIQLQLYQFAKILFHAIYASVILNRQLILRAIVIITTWKWSYSKAKNKINMINCFIIMESTQYMNREAKNIIYIYIVIHRQTVSFYQNSSEWLDTQDARSPSNFTLD